MHINDQGRGRYRGSYIPNKQLEYFLIYIYIWFIIQAVLTQCNHLRDMSESIPWQYVIIRGLLFLIGPEYCKFGW